MCPAEPIFSEQDRKLIEALVFDPSLTPEFNAVSTCLYWEDEMPEGISVPGMKEVRTLWLARGYLHQGLTLDAYFVNPEALKSFWKQATEEIPDWPGFKRLVLNKKDKDYFEMWLSDKNPFE